MNTTRNATADTSTRSPFAAQPVWSLRGEAGPNGSAGTVTVTNNPFTIGRSSRNDFCIGNPTVSGQHAELVEVSDSLVVRDLNSTNGTFLNGRRVERHELLGPGDVLQFGAVAFKLCRSDMETASSGTISSDVAMDAVAFVQFEQMLAERAIVPHYQPIVDKQARPIAYEILGRGRVFGLESPAAMFRAATRLQSEVALSRMMRQEGMRDAEAIPGNLELFVNTHPTELLEPGLVESIWALRSAFPEPRIVLEVHEGAAAGPDQLRSLTEALRELEIGVAYDDFGNGQSRLNDLTDVLPDYVKFDASLIQKIDASNAQRRGMLESLVKMVADLGITTIAEGIENEREAEVCWELGFDLAQGYHFGRPAPASAWSANAGTDTSHDASTEESGDAR